MLHHCASARHLWAEVNDACALWIIATTFGVGRSSIAFQHTAARLLDVDESPLFPFGGEGPWQEEVAHLLPSPPVDAFA